MSEKKKFKLLKDLKEPRMVPLSEAVIYMLGVFFYTNMTGCVNAWRQAYMVDILRIDSSQVSTLNFVTAIAGYVINFFLIMIIDRPPKPGKQKFTPFIAAFVVPFAVFGALSYYTPNALIGTNFVIFYLMAVTIIYNMMNTFCGTITNIGMVISPNLEERDEIMSWRSIISAISNSAPQVIILVVGAIVGLKIDKSENRQLFEQTEYFATAILCAVCALIFMSIMAKKVKERVVYSHKRVNPILGYKDVITNKYAWMTLISEFLKSFRNIATYMGVFLAAVVLGSSDKYILIGLPTGIGTFVGMLLISALLKKFNYKQLYIGSGIYSVIANICAFGVGYIYLKQAHPGVLISIIFYIFLFLIGIQFGASNMLPTLFQADILEDIELQTGKRLEVSLGFVIGIGSTISGAIASSIAPKLLYGDNSLIGYVQGAGSDQALKTKLLILFFYTVFHGIMMLLAGIPYIPYDLTGEKKEKIHAAVLERRAQIANQNEGAYLDDTEEKIEDAVLENEDKNNYDK